MSSSNPIPTRFLPEEAAVLHIVQTFLSCIKTRNKALMHSMVLPSGSACLLRQDRQTRQMQPLHMTLTQCIDRVGWDWPADHFHDEQMYNAKVMVDGELAMARTPYVFFVGERLNHTGTNVLTLWKREGRWVISGIADVAREVEREESNAGQME